MGEIWPLSSIRDRLLLVWRHTLGTWRPRCTRGALSGTRHVVPSPFPPLIAHVTAPPSGAASPMGPVSYTTHVSAPVSVHFPQLSPRVCSYPPITPNPCALGQQV